MPKLSNISVNEYVTIQALQSPSLYGARSFESAKLAVLDHLLSTLGNGITFHGLLKDIQKNKINKEILAQESAFLFDGTPMYYISKKCEKIASYRQERLINPETGEEVFTLPMSKIKAFGWDDPNQYEWFESSNKETQQWAPYPCFQKKYSILWGNEQKLNMLPADFLHAFIEYYKIVLDFLTTDKQYFYHYACPRPNDDKAWEHKLSEWQAIFVKYTASIDGEEAKMLHFSTGYGQTYTGNMREFLENRHAKIINEAVVFVNDTIAMLENKI